MTSARIESEARDRAQFILGAISLLVWFVVAFGLCIAWFVDEYTASPILTAGGIAFVVAAIPWLAYHPLVSRLRTVAERKTQNAERL